MCYDYHGKWDKRTGHNAPLGPRPDEAGADLTLNLEYTVQYLLQVGVTGHVSRVTPRVCCSSAPCPRRRCWGCRCTAEPSSSRTPTTTRWGRRPRLTHSQVWHFRFLEIDVSTLYTYTIHIL